MSYQGLQLIQNLSESLQDNQSLVNLAGAGIDEDISLFVNNLKNTSSIDFDPSGLGAQIIDSSDGTPTTRFLFPRTVQFTYTTGDRVTVEIIDPESSEVTANNLDGTTEVIDYIVTDFEINLGERKTQYAFGLTEDENGSGSLVDVSNTDGMIVRFTRKDFISRFNLLNLIRVGIGDRSFGSFGSELQVIEGRIDTANFKKEKKYSKTDSISTDDEIGVLGTLRTDDPANALTSDSDFDNPNVPGMFITDPFSDPDDIQRARAFSTLGNPWEEVSSTSALETPSSQVNIGDLRFESTIQINGLDVSDQQSILGSDFTYKIPVVIDGIEYFLLLTQSSE